MTFNTEFTPTPTRPGQFLLINGALLFVVLSYVVYQLARAATVARALDRRFPFRAPTQALVGRAIAR